MPPNCHANPFLVHELQVRDVRVWLEEAAWVSENGQKVLEWKDGDDAAIDLSREWRVKPDAWFAYQIKSEEKPVVLVGIVEMDRGTERGSRRWEEKLKAYRTLFANSQLQQVTGYINARILVFTPDARRRDQLAELIAKNDSVAAARFWLAECTILGSADMTGANWRHISATELMPIVKCSAI